VLEDVAHRAAAAPHRDEHALPVGTAVLGGALLPFYNLFDSKYSNRLPERPNS
jgi:hypothetical protein